MMDDDDDGPWGARPKPVPRWAGVVFMAGYIFALGVLLGGAVLGGATLGFAVFHILLALAGK